MGDSTAPVFHVMVFPYEEPWDIDSDNPSEPMFDALVNMEADEHAALKQHLDALCDEEAVGSYFVIPMTDANRVEYDAVITKVIQSTGFDADTRRRLRRKTRKFNQEVAISS